MEDAYLEFLDLEPKELKKAKGRGSVKWVENTPEPRGNEHKRIRNEWSYKARRCLKQARRAEQIAYRMLMLIDEEEIKGPMSKEARKEWETHNNRPRKKGREYVEKEEVQTTYGTLNSDSMKLLRKSIDKETQWEEEIGKAIKKLQKESQVSVMNVPNLKRAAAKYHEAYAAHRRKGIEEHHKAQMLIYKKKDKGQWDLYRHMK